VGAEPSWDAAFRERVEAVRAQPGWVTVQLCIPADAPNERVVIGTWETRAAWEAWHASDVFERTRQQMDEAEEGERDDSWNEVILDVHR
jgi:heme-degrading monooxygenase HmoA